MVGLRIEEVNVAGASYSQTVLFPVFILTVDRIVSMARVFHLEINEEDIEELVEEHTEDLTTVNLE